MADSQADKMDENIESLNNLRDNLEEYGYDINDIPIVIQYNKRDLPNVLPIEELEAKLNPQGWQWFEAEAVNGRGVFDTLKCIIKLVLDKAKSSSKSKSSEKPKPKPAASAVASTEVPKQTVAAPVGATASAVPPPTPPPSPTEAPASPAQSPQVSSPAPAAPPQAVRESAYKAPPPEVEAEEEDEDEEQVVEYNTLKEDTPDVATPKPEPQAPESTPTEEPQGMAKVEPEPRPVRPFPGSAPVGSRRERRITVSDFQRSMHEEEPSSISKLAEANEKITGGDSEMPTPTMAPSNRKLTKKKRGFFKRLFGIK